MSKGIRVHELAKEFKISTAALKKHLQDLGVDVKSHMSVVDHGVVDKIRAKFNEQKAAIRKRETDKKKYHKVGKEIKKEEKSVKPKDDFSFKKEAKKIKDRNPYDNSDLPSAYKRRKNTPKDNNGSYSNKKNNDAGKERTTRVINTENNNKTYNSGNNKRNDKFNKKNDKYNKNKNDEGHNENDRRKFKSVPPVDNNIIDSSVVDKTPKRSIKYNKDKKNDSQEEKNKHLKAKLKLTKFKKPKYRPTEEEEADINKSIKAVISTSKKKKNKKKYKLQKEEKQIVKEQKKLEDNKIILNEFTSVSELAKIMDVSPTEIIAKFFSIGQMVTINQRLDKDSLEMICDEFEFEITFQDEYGTELLEESITKIGDSVETSKRPSVVTIMGHVDHGKTSILDYIRNENIVSGESGGITQHIGAYQIEHNGEKITFLDTPGHEAFTAMRSRGANVTDIAIIVVAANDGVMPQTIEAIDHAKAAGVSIIVAINKVDLPEANPDLAIHGLSEQNIFLENYGGDIPYVLCSAKTGEGIDSLLDYILITAELNEYSAKKEVPAKGIVIESQKDQRTGSFATILIQEGTLSKGDNVVCGATSGRVRKLVNEKSEELKIIGPSDVAVIYGLDEVPKAGDVLHKVESDKVARQISSERKQMRLEREKYQVTANTSNIFDKIRKNQMSELKIIIKADTDGSVEALADSFQKLSNDEVNVNIIHKSVGGIIEADVTLASASEALIIGFHVRSSNPAKKLAEEQNVTIKNYQIIYNAINDVKASLSGMLSPELQEEFLGNALIKQLFKIKKIGVIAGCVVEKGRITSDAKLRLYRNNIMVHEGNVDSLKHYAKDVNEVKAGAECGIGIENFNDLKEGDIIEAYKVIEVERKI